VTRTTIREGKSMEQEPEEQVTLDFTEFDDEVVDRDGEPMVVVVVDSDYRPDFGEVRGGGAVDDDHRPDPGEGQPVPGPSQPCE
jgi:hypothetical protein